VHGLVDGGMQLKPAAARIAQERGVPKNLLYSRALQGD
jgi:hypothetical protein